MDDFGNTINYSLWTESGYDHIVQGAGCRGCYGFCGCLEMWYLQCAMVQVL